MIVQGAEVRLLSALAPAGELKILVHPCSNCRGDVMFLPQRVMKEPLRDTFRHDRFQIIEELRGATFGRGEKP
jgi:hypothetical protein